MQSFSVGGVLGRSFSIWLKNFLPFTVLSLLVYSPLLIYTAIFMSGDITLASLVTWGLITAGGAFVLGLVSTGAMTFGVFQQLRGQHASIMKCVAVGFSRMLPVLGVGILVALVLGGMAAVLMLPGILGKSPGLLIVGMLGAVVMVIIYALKFYVAVPVAVVERPGVFASIKRSSDLTMGYKGSIFGILFVLGIIGQVCTYIVKSSTLGSTPDVDALKTYVIASVLLTAALGALGSVANAVVYHDLRVVKEGVGTDELAKVFD